MISPFPPCTHCGGNLHPVVHGANSFPEMPTLLPWIFSCAKCNRTHLMVTTPDGHLLSVQARIDIIGEEVFEPILLPEYQPLVPVRRKVA